MSKEMKTLIFSGYNQRAVFAFLRTLKEKGLPFGVVASSKDDPVFSSVYKDKVVSTRREKELSFDDLRKSISESKSKLGTNKLFIAPSTEALNRFILDNRKAFEKLNCEVPLVSKELYKKISDKHDFHLICQQHDISVPKIYDIEDASFPFVAKPYTYLSPGGKTHAPVIIADRNDLDIFRKTYHGQEFFYEEFVDGESYYFLYYFSRNGQVFKFSQKNLIQQPAGKSILAACSSDVHNTEESAKYVKLFHSLGFYGLVMVEVKLKGEKYTMIEANPRFWGPSQLFVDAEANLFDAMLKDYSLIDKEPSINNPRNSRYFWFGGLLETVRSSESMVFHGYGKEEFAESITEWLSADVYLREDTKEFFTREAKL